jgi:hypothetical protein
VRQDLFRVPGSEFRVQDVEFGAAVRREIRPVEGFEFRV